MNIEEMDRNFQVTCKEKTKDQDVYNILSEKCDLYGVKFDEKNNRFVRLDLDFAKSITDLLFELSKCPAGGRVRFSTDSPMLSLSAKYNTDIEPSYNSKLGISGFILLEDTDDIPKYICSFAPKHYLNLNEVDFADGLYVERTFPTDGKVRNYTLFLPNMNDLVSLDLGVKKGSFFGHGKKQKDFKPILYYGSSITQGACAARPDNSYEGFIYKWTNIDFLNMGFSASCYAEIPMIDYLSKIDCSIFVYDYDHNALTPKDLKSTHLNGYKRYRETHPLTPFIMMSMPSNACGDWEERREVILESYNYAINNGDKNVYFVDGHTMFPKLVGNSCTVDGTHPNDLGFYYMAKSVYDVIKKILNL